MRRENRGKKKTLSKDEINACVVDLKWRDCTAIKAPICRKKNRIVKRPKYGDCMARCCAVTYTHAATNHTNSKSQLVPWHPTPTRTVTTVAIAIVPTPLWVIIMHTKWRLAGKTNKQ